MRISKKRIKQLKKELKEKQENSIIKKPMRPIFFKRNILCGGEVDWDRTNPYMKASL